MNLFTQKRGFTLVELLVVVSIIGILSTIVVSGLNNAKKAGRDAKRISDIKNIQLSLALYYNDNSHFPCSLSGVGNTAGSSCYPDFTPTYMPSLPKDPITGSDYVYTALNSNNSVNCTGANLAIQYHLGASMESNTTLLTQDKDQVSFSSPYGVCTGTTNFDGNATGCVGTSAVAPDTCYDVIANF